MLVFIYLLLVSFFVFTSFYFFFNSPTESSGGGFVPENYKPLEVDKPFKEEREILFHCIEKARRVHYVRKKNTSEEDISFVRYIYLDGEYYGYDFVKTKKGDIIDFSLYKYSPRGDQVKVVNLSSDFPLVKEYDLGREDQEGTMYNLLLAFDNDVANKSFNEKYQGCFTLITPFYLRRIQQLVDDYVDIIESPEVQDKGECLQYMYDTVRLILTKMKNEYKERLEQIKKQEIDNIDLIREKGGI